MWWRATRRQYCARTLQFLKFYQEAFQNSVYFVCMWEEIRSLPCRKLCRWRGICCWHHVLALVHGVNCIRLHREGCNAKDKSNSHIERTLRCVFSFLDHWYSESFLGKKYLLSTVTCSADSTTVEFVATGRFGHHCWCYSFWWLVPCSRVLVDFKNDCCKQDATTNFL